MKRTIRRTIVVEYESDRSVAYERLWCLSWDRAIEGWSAPWTPDAEIRETVEEITEESHRPPDGVSGRTDQ